MNSNAQAQPLNAAEQNQLKHIERMLGQQRGDDLDVRSLEDFAVFLANATPAPDPQMAARIETRLLTAFQAQAQPLPGSPANNHIPPSGRPAARRFSRLAMRAVAFTALALLLATALAPPLRAAAQEWLGRIGNLLITGEQTQAERDFQQIEQLQTEWPGLPAEPVDLAEIAAQLDFALLVPTALPEDLTYQTARVTASEDSPTARAILSYGGAYPLTIEQTPTAHGRLEQLAVGAEVTPALMVVRGNLAYWLENVPHGLGGVLNDEAVITNPALYYDSMLIWEEDGILYRITGLGTRRPTSRLDAPTTGAPPEQPGLTLDTALRIAESMAPYGD